MKTSTFRNLFILFLGIISLAVECNKGVTNEGSNVMAFFTVEPETGSVGTEFRFDSYESKCDVVLWDFDYQGEDDIFWDTDKMYAGEVTHIYTEAKTYTVLLRALDEDKDNSFSDEMTRTVIVTEDTNSDPIAIFSFNPSKGNTLTDFSFDASECVDESTPSQNLEVAWDFDNDGNWDNLYSTEKIVVHRFDSVGDYEVRMRVKDGDGNETELIKNLTVENCNEGGEPCEGVAFVMIDGEQYNTVQIGDQCWLNRNLNRGIMIESVSNQTEQTDNDVIEKFCYDNNNAFCEIYGGLYQWHEMMEYVSTEGAQGICPDGWHIPTNAEWNELVNYLEGEYLASQKLKSCTDDWNYWYSVVNSNESGFTGLPGGVRQYWSPFESIYELGIFWTSSVGLNPGNGEIFSLGYNYGIGMNGGGHPHNTGISVRCIKD